MMAHIVVVGAGPAGSAAAADLVSRGHLVTMCETGAGRSVAQRWPLVGDAARSAYLGGVGVGGSSGINGAVLGPATEAAPVDVPSFVADVGDVGTALVAAAAASAAVPLRLLGRDGHRCSVADALGLTELESLNIRSERVLSLSTHGPTAVGVHTESGHIIADGAILAAGPIGSPLILAASGLPLDGVGAGLRDHRSVTVVFDGPGSASARPAASIAADVDGGVLIALDHFGFGSPLGGLLVVSDTPSRGGRVFRSTTTGAVTVDLGPLDVGSLSAVWAAARPIVERMAAEWAGVVLIDEWGTPLRRLSHDADHVAAWIRRSAGGAFHAVGTCRSAVDAHGRLTGVPRVVVAGAPVLASPPRWPMTACVASGRAAAALIDSDLLVER